MGTQHQDTPPVRTWVGAPYGQQSYKVDFTVSYLASYGGPWVPPTGATSYKIHGLAAAGTLCLCPARSTSAWPVTCILIKR